MGDLQRTHSKEPASAGREAVAPCPGQCAYCQAPLDGRFYFCLRCAMPYKNVAELLPPSSPLYLTDGMLIEKKAPGVAPLFWTYFSVIVAMSIGCYLLFGREKRGLGILVQMPILFATTCVFAALHWRSLHVQLKRVGLFSIWTLLGVLALGPLLGLSYAYHAWLTEIAGLESGLAMEQLREWGLSKAALIFIYCVFPAVTEEIAFRGLLQHWLQVAIPPRRALVLAAALFTVLHFSIISAPFIFGAGIILGWVKQKTVSLYPCMLIHFLHNLIVIEFFSL